MKDKKGFTLIELLAVLVVLAILALISVPITIRIINNARENSNKRSIANYGRTVENAVGQYLISEPNADYSNINLNTIRNYIDYSGNTVTCRKLTINSSSDIILEGCQVNNSEQYKYENRNVIQSNFAYQIGDSFTLKGEGYHIIADSSSSSNYVVALKDEPLTADEVITFGGTTSDSGNSVGNMSFGTNSTYASSLVKSVVNAWAQSKFTNGELKEVDGYSARLLKYDEIFNLGYENAVACTGECYYTGSISDVPSWVYNSGYQYWTMSVNNDSSLNVWSIKNSGDVRDNLVTSEGAVRPVINVYKMKISA